MKSLLSLLLFVLMPAMAHPSAGLAQMAFPLRADRAWSERAVRLLPDHDLIAELHGLERVFLTGVPVPSSDGLQVLDLILHRFRVVHPDAAWHVDGRVVGGRAELETDHTLWRGKVIGEPDSSIYLAFTSTGSRGWIERADGKSLLISVPEDGDWSRTYGVLVHETDPIVRDGDVSFTCGVDASMLRPARQRVEADPTRLRSAPRAVTSYECLIACETDYQFFELFGDVQAATNYAISIWGAVTDRYLDACNTFFTLPYLGIYSTPSDPWTSQDTGGTSFDLLDEFIGAWGGSTLPGGANLAHFMSGATIGGGVAYIDVLCNPDWGFAVSGSIGGLTSFPVPTTDALAWDFYVVAHETGHNFGAFHTHEYCPPIDLCPSRQYWGPCQSRRVCQVGTIMSYCYHCPGGFDNIRTAFHPQIADIFLAGIQSSCATSYASASATVRNGSGINPVGYSSLAAPEIGTTWVAHVQLSSRDDLFSALAVAGGGPFPGSHLSSIGEILIDVSMPLLMLDVGAGAHWIRIPDDASLVGRTLCTQAATLGKGAIQLQNALDLYLAY